MNNQKKVEQWVQRHRGRLTMACKAGVYMTISIYLGCLPMDPSNLLSDYLYLFTTMILIAIFLFVVPWRRLDSIVIS